MRNSGIPLSSCPPKLRAMIEAQDKALGSKPTPQNPSHSDLLQLHGSTDAPRLRQSSKGPNKTEAAFAAYLQNLYPSYRVDFEYVTLKIGNGVRYSPDIALHLGVPGCSMTFYEVKGPHAWDDSIVKLKVAARAHSWAQFFLASPRARTGRSWDIQRILP